MKGSSRRKAKGAARGGDGWRNSDRRPLQPVRKADDLAGTDRGSRWLTMKVEAVLQPLQDEVVGRPLRTQLA